MDLTPTEMTETKETAEQQPDAAHTHDEHHHDHDHDHEHVHQQAPALNPELTREIEVEAPADEVSKSFHTVVKRYQKLARIPGFRAGKVPESLIRSKFAKEVRQEVLESLVSEKFPQCDRRAEAAACFGAAACGAAAVRGTAAEVQGGV